MEIFPNRGSATALALAGFLAVADASPGPAAAVSPTCVAGAVPRAYLVQGSDRARQRDGPSMPPLTSPRLALPGPMVAAGALVAVLVAGAIVLWAHYGTAVFYEMVAAGIASCL